MTDFAHVLTVTGGFFLAPALLLLLLALPVLLISTSKRASLAIRLKWAGLAASPFVVLWLVSRWTSKSEPSAGLRLFSIAIAISAYAIALAVALHFRRTHRVQAGAEQESSTPKP